MGIRKSIKTLTLLTAMACTAQLAVAQETKIGDALSAEQVRFIEGVIAGMRQSMGIPAMGVSVFSSAGVRFSGLYGYTDAEGQVMGSVSDTVMPIASISKTFVAVALMRAQELGLLSLDDEANKHLDFKLPAYPDSRSITLRDLARHEAGFEERWLATGAGLEADTRSWGEILAHTCPRLIAPPGSYASYSNYGIALLGYIVQRAAGMPYYEFVEREILAPLAMRATVVRHPDPGTGGNKAVYGFHATGGVVRKPQESFNLRTYPAGRVLSTLADMAKFGAMVLRSGTGLNGVRVLQSASVDEMIRNTKAVHPRMPGIGVVFAEKDIQGIRFVGHGGDGSTHHTDLLLSPEHDLGIYVEFLSAPGPHARDYFTRAIIPQLIPEAGFKPLPFARDGPRADTRPYLGDYRHYRWAFTSIERVLQLVSQFSVKAAGNGNLIVAGRLGAGEYIPTGEPGLFRNRLTGELIYFWQDEQGRWNQNMGSFPYVTAFKLKTIATQAFNRKAFNFFVLAFSALGAALVYFLANRLRARQRAQASGFGLLAVCCALSVYGLLGFLSAAEQTSELALQQGIPAFAYWYLSLPFVVMVLCAVYLWGACRLDWRPAGVIATIVSALVPGLFLLLLLYLNYWNALGWNFP